MATGRTDYPNQVNNVLCFPFIFRGALDCGATTINEEMKIAAADAIAALARVEASEVVAAAYGGQAPVFGPDYIIPKPFDPRLILEIAPAVARAAMESGVAVRPIADFAAYRRDLERNVFRSGNLMRPVFEAARKRPRRVAYAEGEDERTLRAVQSVVDEGIAEPILVGRRDVIAAKVKALGLRMALGDSVRVLDPAQDADIFGPLTDLYRLKVGRRGTPPDAAAKRVVTRPAVAASLLLEGGHADAAICGGLGDWMGQWTHVLDIIGKREDVGRVYALSGVVTRAGEHLFVVDTHLCLEPTPDQIAEMTLLAAEQVRAFGLTPKVALLSHSSFGASHAFGAADAPGAEARAHARPGAGSGWGDACGCRADPGDPRPRRARQPARRGGEPARHAGDRRGQHRLQPGEGGDRRAAARPAAAGHEQADPRAGAFGDGARHPERDGARGRAGERGRIGACRAGARAPARFSNRGSDTAGARTCRSRHRPDASAFLARRSGAFAPPVRDSRGRDPPRPPWHAAKRRRRPARRSRDPRTPTECIAILLAIYSTLNDFGSTLNERLPDDLPSPPPRRHRRPPPLRRSLRANPAAPWDAAPASRHPDWRVRAAHWAVLAPNPHNRQPWILDLAADGSALLRCDLDRRLPATDPLDRQVTIGLGAFAELFRMAAAEEGRAVAIEPFPEGAPAPRLDARPVARLRLLPGRADRDPLFAHAPRRRSAKEPFDTARPVAREAIAALAAATGPAFRATTSEGRWRRCATSPGAPG